MKFCAIRKRISLTVPWIEIQTHTYFISRKTPLIYRVIQLVDRFFLVTLNARIVALYILNVLHIRSTC